MFENEDDGYYADLESEMLTRNETAKVKTKTAAERSRMTRQKNWEKGEASEDSEIVEERVEEQQALEKLEDDEEDIEVEEEQRTEQESSAPEFDVAYKEDDKAVMPER